MIIASLKSERALSFSYPEETAQETLLRVLDRLDSFEGRSQFMTWVYTIAVRIALTELRRKRWKNVSLESMVSKDNQDLSEQMFRDEKIWSNGNGGAE